MSEIKTRVFQLAETHGYTSNAELGRAMGIHESIVSRIRSGERRVTRAFILGALRAFPGLTFDELFEVVEDTDSPAA